MADESEINEAGRLEVKPRGFEWRLRRTTGAERRHRDRGNAEDSPGWRESVRRCRD